MTQVLRAKRPAYFSQEPNLTEDGFSTGRMARSPYPCPKRTRLKAPEGSSWTLPYSCGFHDLRILSKNYIRSDVFHAEPPTLGFPSNMALGTDLFFDCCEATSNTSDTLAARRGYLGETGYPGNGGKYGSLPLKLERDSVNRLTKPAITQDNFSGTLIKSQTSWKPPKPPKPPHLSHTEVPFVNKSENVRPSRSLDFRESTDSYLQSGYQPLSRRSGVAPLRYTDQSTRGISRDQFQMKKPKSSFGNRDMASWRYVPRHSPYRIPGPLHLPLSDQGLPFPARIPTVDKLPLRRGIVGMLQGTDANSRAQETRGVAGKLLKDAAKYLIKKAHISECLKSIAVKRHLCGDLLGQSLHLHFILCVRFNTNQSVSARCAECPEDLEETSVVGSKNGDAYALQAGFTIPIPFIFGFMVIGSIARSCPALRPLTVVLSFIRIIAIIPTLWILRVLRIEAVSQIRKI